MLPFYLGMRRIAGDYLKAFWASVIIAVPKAWFCRTSKHLFPLLNIPGYDCVVSSILNRLFATFPAASFIFHQ